MPNQLGRTVAYRLEWRSVQQTHYPPRAGASLAWLEASTAASAPQCSKQNQTNPRRIRVEILCLDRGSFVFARRAKRFVLA